MNAKFYKFCVILALLGVPSLAYAYGEGEDIPYGARAIHLLTNESRCNIPDALAGCGENCAEPVSCFPEVLAPVWWDTDLYRMAQFHSVLQANLACTCQHPSPCDLNPSIYEDYPDVCDGSVSCACTDTPTTCRPDGTSPSARGYGFSSYFAGENVAWASDIKFNSCYNRPYTMFYLWLYEPGDTDQCVSTHANGHRFNILSGKFVSMGVGFTIKYTTYPQFGDRSYYGVYGTQDFGRNAAVKPALTSGSHYFDEKNKLHFNTHYYSADSQVNKVMLAINGECRELSLIRGTTKNGVYGTTEIAEPAKCTPYFYEVQDAGGNVTKYPTTGSLTYSIDSEGKQCEKSWQLTEASSCFSDGPRCVGDQHLNEAGDACEDNSAEHCGVYYNDCTQMAGWGEGTCKNGSCNVTTCADGYHIYRGICEKDSVSTCGSHENRCDSAIAGWKSGTCDNGACKPTACKTGFYLDNNKCNADSVSNCGEKGKNCATLIDGWSKGTCTKGVCTVTECKPKYTVKNNKCEIDPTQSCGTDKTDCTATAGWSEGKCESGACVATKCKDNYHVYNKSCEADTDTACGSHEKDCTALPGWDGGSCTHTECKATACKPGYHLSEGVCESDSVSQCGPAHTDCTQAEGWSVGTCENDNCVVSKCIDGYHLYNSACEADSVEHCGSHENDCSSAIAFWADGTCTAGSCEVTSCTQNKLVSGNQCTGDNTIPGSGEDPGDQPGNGDNTPSGEEDTDYIAKPVSDDCSGIPQSGHSSVPLFMLVAAGALLGLRRRRYKSL